MIMALKKSEKTVASRPARSRNAAGPGRGTTREGARTATGSRTNVSVMPYTEAQIRERAYYIYLERGGAMGDPVSDWVQAERELNDLVRVVED
jgi:hypothetical protein